MPRRSGGEREGSNVETYANDTVLCHRMLASRRDSRNGRRRITRFLRGRVRGKCNSVCTVDCDVGDVGCIRDNASAIAYTGHGLLGRSPYSLKRPETCMAAYDRR